jgi:Na+-translocating ferredoxin:NAD+ oxidoreductase RnfC subunit
VRSHALGNRVMMQKDGKESVDAMLMECCRCRACAIQLCRSSRNRTVYIPVFVEARERALADTRRRIVELAQGDEQQLNEMSGWPVTTGRGWTCSAQASRTVEAS